MNYLMGVDKALLSFFSERMRNGLFDVLMPFLSLINNHGEVWIALAIILMINKNTDIRRLGVSVLISVAIGYLLGDTIIKNIVERARPIGPEFNFKFIITPPRSYSFPSGHTTSSFAAFGAFLFSKARHKYWVLALAVSIAFSRMYLHVHYPSDILGGIILGLLCAKIGTTLGKSFFKKKTSI